MPATAAPRLLLRDGDLLVLAKPAGMHVFGPAPSVCAWALLRWPKLAAVGPRSAPAIAHRLDRDTSGLLLAATGEPAYRALRQEFSGQGAEKVYLGLVEGAIEAPVRLDLPLGARYRGSRRVWVERRGLKLRGVRPACTEVVPLACRQGWTLCRLVMRSGMRHQLRAHLSHLGHPLAGDRLYGARRQVPRLEVGFWLHAWGVALRHPSAPRRLRLVCPLPSARLAVLDELGFNPSAGPFEEG